MGEPQMQAVEDVDSCVTALDESYTADWFCGLAAPVRELRCVVHSDESIFQHDAISGRR